ncbi:MAG: hypothetical protein IPJ71_10640 [Bdellovibrionales bacterium]|nr:hypothetical protein [Bdellovibrionales bacterium]
MAKKTRSKKYIYPDAKAWAPVPESLLAAMAYSKSPVSEVTCVVYAVIARHFDARMSLPLAFPGLDRLSERTGLSRGTISRHLKILDRGKWLKKMYVCRIKNKSVLDSMTILPPLRSHSDAQDKAKKYKKKTDKSCTVVLLFYGTKEGVPDIESLQKMGWLPPSLEEVDSASNIGLFAHCAVGTPHTDMSGDSLSQEQENSNLGTFINLKSESVDNIDSNNMGESDLGESPLSKFIRTSDRKMFFEHGVEEDPSALDTLMHLKVLGEQGSVSGFEAFRAKEQKWMLHEISVNQVNRLLLKLDYLGQKLPSEITKAVDLLRGGDHGVLKGQEIQSLVRKIRDEVPLVKGP